MEKEEKIKLLDKKMEKSFEYFSNKFNELAEEIKDEKGLNIFLEFYDFREEGKHHVHKVSNISLESKLLLARRLEHEVDKAIKQRVEEDEKNKIQISPFKIRL